MIHGFKEFALYDERMCYDTYKHVHPTRALVHSFSTFKDFQELSMLNDNGLIANWFTDLQECDITF